MILPLLALRRLDAVLEPTKQQVLAQAATFESIGPGQDLLLKRTAGFDFYNISPLTLTSMLADDKHVAEQLSTYITGLSPAAADVMDAYNFAESLGPPCPAVERAANTRHRWTSSPP